MTFVGFDLHKRYITACAMTLRISVLLAISGLPFSALLPEKL